MARQTLTAVLRPAPELASRSANSKDAPVRSFSPPLTGLRAAPAPSVARPRAPSGSCRQRRSSEAHCGFPTTHQSARAHRCTWRAPPLSSRPPTTLRRSKSVHHRVPLPARRQGNATRRSPRTRPPRQRQGRKSLLARGRASNLRWKQRISRKCDAVRVFCPAAVGGKVRMACPATARIRRGNTRRPR